MREVRHDTVVGGARFDSEREVLVMDDIEILVTGGNMIEFIHEDWRFAITADCPAGYFFVEKLSDDGSMYSGELSPEAVDILKGIEND